MAHDGKVLIVGGGIAGMCCALALRRAGIPVDLVEIDPTWSTFAAGLTLTGPTLRALQQIGVLDEIRPTGAIWERVRAFNQSGEFVRESNLDPVAEDLPAAMGVLRPDLHRILSSRTLSSGTHVRLGTTVTALSQVPGGVEVKLTNGHREHYRLALGADGIYSKLRERIFPQCPRPRFTGQVIYRLLTARLPEVDCAHVYAAADARLELYPVSRTHLSMSLLLKAPSHPWVPVADQPRRLYRALQGWGGVVPEICRSLAGKTAGPVNYRPLETLLLPDPWFRDRVLLVGDAAHTTTPHLACGAGMAAEDGVVLAEEMTRDDETDAALMRFMARRFERGRLLAEHSLRLGEIEMSRGTELDHIRVVQAATAALARPA